MTEEQLQRFFTEDGRLYAIPEYILDKFVGNDPRREELWAFAIGNPEGMYSSYSHVFKDIEGKSLEKDTRRIFYDSQYFFCLALGDALIACVGFSQRMERFTPMRILVEQLQGKRYREEELKGLRWEKLLLSIVCHWGFVVDKDVTRINVYCRAREVTKETTNLNLRMIYLVTPHRLGFKYVPANTTWVKRPSMEITKKQWGEWVFRNLPKGVAERLV